MVARVRKQLKWLRFGALLIPGGLALLWSYETWQAEWQRAAEHARRNAELASEFTQRIVQGQQIALDRADILLRRYSDASDIALLAEELEELRNTVPLTHTIAVIDDSGKPVAASQPLAPGASFNERPFFQVLSAQPEILVIDRQILRPSGLDALLFARRTTERQGWTVVSTIDVAAIRDFYQRLAREEHAVASVATRDGRLLVRNLAMAGPTKIAPDSPYLQAIRNSSEGLIQLSASVDGVKRLYAYKQIADLPLYANVGFSEASIHAAIVEELIPHIVVLFLAAVLGYIAVGQVQRRLETQVSLIAAQRSAELKDSLFNEMNHRIRNNLLAVQSLISLQARKAGLPPAIFQDIEKRIWAISEVHNLLYSAESASTMDFGSFLRALCSNPSIVPPETGIAVRCETAHVEIDTRQAVPAALILLEMLTNAVKHAFPNGGGTITVLLSEDDSAALAIVSDDGVGLPEQRRRNSGLQLIQGFARQIGATLDVAVNNGTTFTLRFPKAGGPPLMTGEQHQSKSVSDTAPGQTPPDVLTAAQQSFYQRVL